MDAKQDMIGNYVRQQSQLTGSQSNELMVLPENITLEEFRGYVKKYLELDSYIKKAREIIRDKKKQKDKLSEVISKFMIKFNIEDLKTKDGCIRCKVGYVKTPVSQKAIKEKITDYFKNDENECKEVIHKVFEQREKIEKVSLRRLKVS
jgi:hypothetical protein